MKIEKERRRRRKKGRKDLLCFFFFLFFTHITVMISPKPKAIPCIWAMNMLATATNNAVPSMLILQPIGRTNLVTLGSTRSLSVIRRKVTGSAAALYKTALGKIEENAVESRVDYSRKDYFCALRSRCPWRVVGG